MAKMALEHKLHSLCFLHIFWLISFILRIKLLPDLFLSINQNIIIMVSCQRRGLVLTISHQSAGSERLHNPKAS